MSKNQWELKLKTRNLIEARENASDQNTSSFKFESDWSRKWCKFSGPIIYQEVKKKQSNARLLSTLN